MGLFRGTGRWKLAAGVAPGAAAYAFANAFDYTQAPLAPVRMMHRPLPASARRIHLTPALENDPT
jgi:hypothetical protein